VSHFIEEAANPNTLAALTVGGLAYRVGRLGTLALAANTGERLAPILRLGSYAIGLGTEVTAFEFANRSLISLGERAGLKPAPTENLWNWSGPGGWREGLASSAITFGLLKGAGFLGREQNIILQHAIQSAAMVSGHQIAGILGLTERPEGSLAEQLLHAEATNLQLATGTSIVHSISPGLSAMERGLDLSLQHQTFGISRWHPLMPAFAMRETPPIPRRSSSEETETHNILMMSGDNPKEPPSDETPSTSRHQNPLELNLSQRRQLIDTIKGHLQGIVRSDDAKIEVKTLSADDFRQM